MKPSRLVAMKTDAFNGDMVVVVSGSWPFGSGGCDRRDSNPHGLPHRILSPARLPVPPRSRDCCASTYAVGRWRDTGVCAATVPLNRRALPPRPSSGLDAPFAVSRSRPSVPHFRPAPPAPSNAAFPHDDDGGQLGAPEGRRTVPTAPRGVVRGEGGRERRGASPREREVGARAVAGGRGDRVAAEPLDRRAASRERRDDSRKLGGALCRVPTVPPPRPLTGPAGDHAVPAVRQAFPGGVGRGLSRTEVRRGCAAIAPACGWLSTLRLTTDN